MSETIENITNEPETEESNNQASMSPSDYKVIKDMINEMDDWNNMLKEQTHDILKHTYGLTNAAMFGIIPYSNSKIEGMTLDEVVDFFESYHDIRSETNLTIETLEDGIKYMKEVKDLQMSLYAAEVESDKLKDESNDILDEYFNYLSSPEVANARKNRLEKMKSMVDIETDESKKKQILRMIDTMENTESLDFIFKRLNTLGKKEIDSIINTYFDSKRGSYVIDKYKAKVSKFGFNVDLYKYFFNLEENFLDEKYHAFNNLFLFNYMRFVAYSDPYKNEDKLFVQSLTSTIANLIYHKFPSTTAEQNFIHIMEKFEDTFMDKREYFLANNTTCPTHPVRIKATAKFEADRRASLINKMNELHIEGYDENASADDLHKYFNDQMDIMLAEQAKEKEDAKLKEEDDGSISVEPVMEEESTIEESSVPVEEPVPTDDSEEESN